MASRHYSELRSKATLTRIWEDETWVYCQYVDAQGAERQIRCKFLVGADGKTGFTRKKYLEAKGVTMEKAHK